MSPVAGTLPKTEAHDVLLKDTTPHPHSQKDKLDWLHEYRVKNNLDYLLEIDGGINAETGRLAVEHHCDVLVAGSYVFKYPEGIVEGVKSLL